MDDDFEDEFEEQAFEVVEDYETKEQAVDGARVLVEKGIGASVVPIPAAELDEDTPQAGYRIEVLPHELRRAQEVLGLVEPEERPDPSPVEPIKLERAKLPWKTVAVIYLAALIVLPALAFYVTYSILSK